MGGSRAAALKGTKSFRTRGLSFVLPEEVDMRCYRGLTEGLQEPKLRPQNANWKLKRADLRLERAGLGLERSED